MADYQMPEILRTPLEEMCLQVKVRIWENYYNSYYNSYYNIDLT